jgi:hypothetical protein
LKLDQGMNNTAAFSLVIGIVTSLTFCVAYVSQKAKLRASVITASQTNFVSHVVPLAWIRSVLEALQVACSNSFVEQDFLASSLRGKYCAEGSNC